ncbi:hypothetical protein [Methanomethylovorans sp. PtaU1.Bin093]|nr:hypothetical protein [Methanomethylovorans sp. PtaU1.Bin093]
MNRFSDQLVPVGFYPAAGIGQMKTNWKARINFCSAGTGNVWANSMAEY